MSVPAIRLANADRLVVPAKVQFQLKLEGQDRGIRADLLAKPIYEVKSAKQLKPTLTILATRVGRLKKITRFDLDDMKCMPVVFTVVIVRVGTLRNLFRPGQQRNGCEGCKCSDDSAPRPVIELPRGPLLSDGPRRLH